MASRVESHCLAMKGGVGADARITADLYDDGASAVLVQLPDGTHRWRYFPPEAGQALSFVVAVMFGEPEPAPVLTEAALIP